MTVMQTLTSNFAPEEDLSVWVGQVRSERFKREIESRALLDVQGAAVLLNVLEMLRQFRNLHLNFNNYSKLNHFLGGGGICYLR
jgi:hypothetical protein